MDTGRGGMGAHKHGISGHAPKSPRFKMQQAIDAAKQEAQAKAKRRAPQMYGSVRDALVSRKGEHNGGTG